MGKTVTFCGHRELSSEETVPLRVKLYTIIEELILGGATEFLLGGYGEFDLLCASVIREFKRKYPFVCSVLVKAYLNQKYDDTLYDITEYPPLEKVPKTFAIIKRNQYMIEKSDVVVSYVLFSFGGAAKTLEYAIKKRKTVIRIRV